MSLTDASGSLAYWTANARDAEGRVSQETAGSGTVTNRAFDANTGALTGVAAGTGSSVANLAFGFDALGNLTSRGDANLSTSESFVYDGLNRLTSAQVAGQAAHSVSYDTLGNITSKTRLDTNSLLNIYSYPAAGSARPHAVASISGLVNGVLNPTYTYDADGNLTAGGGRAVTWTSFNKVASIVQGSTTMSYAYDADHARITQSETNGSATTTTTYLNDPASGLSSEKTVSGSTTTWTDYLFAGGARVGERVITVGGATTLKYFIADHLGSVSVITDGSGAVLERLSYDAWGKRRNANGTDDPAGAVASAVTRGFSDHEMIASVGLVNMNARLYDPELGRFMSPDSVVPSLLLSQALNRYSYVFNNPCSLTDPSGQFPWGIVALVSGIASLFTHNQIVHTIAAIAIGFEFGPGNWLAGASAPARAFLGGFIVGGVTGHNAQSALFSGLEAFAFAGVGALKGAAAIKEGTSASLLERVESAGLHGLVGGLMSEARGGKFGRGFLSAGFSDFATSYAHFGIAGNTVFAAVVGGVSSELGGGKFANGAITAAFGYLYNEAASDETQLSEAELRARFNAALARCGAQCADDSYDFEPSYVACRPSSTGGCGVKEMRSFGTKAELRAFLDSDEGAGYGETGGVSRVGSRQSTIYASAVDPLSLPITIPYWPGDRGGLPIYKSISTQQDLSLFVLLHEYAHAVEKIRDEGLADSYGADHCDCGRDQR